MFDEMRAWLEQSHNEEIADKEKYERMARTAEERGECRMAGVLRDIAHEEETHAKLIEYLMEKQ